MHPEKFLRIGPAPNRLVYLDHQRSTTTAAIIRVAALPSISTRGAVDRRFVLGGGVGKASVTPHELARTKLEDATQSLTVAHAAVHLAAC